MGGGGGRMVVFSENLWTKIYGIYWQASAETQQSRLKEHLSTESTYLDQIEELTHKLSQAENRIKQFETSRLEDGAKVSVIT